MTINETMVKVEKIARRRCAERGMRIDLWMIVAHLEIFSIMDEVMTDDC
jgi:hypothetical protein